MPEQQVEIRMQDGVSDGVFYCPEPGKKWPGILYLTDIGGIRAAKP